MFKGYTIEQLIDLGDEVQQIGDISVSGSAVKVGKVYIALGLFGYLVKRLSSALIEHQQFTGNAELIENDDPAKIGSSFLNYSISTEGKKPVVREVKLPTLTFLDVATCLPDDGDSDYLYMVRWDHVDADASGRMLCTFQRGSFWRYESDDVIGERFVLEPGMVAEWAVIS